MKNNPVLSGWWVVTLNGKVIEKVWYVNSTAEQVKISLVNHDGYDSSIKVRKECRRPNF